MFLNNLIQYKVICNPIVLSQNYLYKATRKNTNNSIK